VGTVRRECIDRMLVVGQCHLATVAAEYARQRQRSPAAAIAAAPFESGAVLPGPHATLAGRRSNRVRLHLLTRRSS